MASIPTAPEPQIGNWTMLERCQFEEGVIAHGWGNWSSMVGTVITTRNRHQVKSHAQKFRRAHPEMFEQLVREHAKLHRKRAARVKKAWSVAAKNNAAEGVAKKDKKSSSSPPRRRASMIKAKTPAMARNSPRQPRRFSAPGSIGFMRSSSIASKNAEVQSSPPQPAAASSPPSPADSILSSVINDMCRTTLGSDAPSMSAFFTEFLSPSPGHSPLSATPSSHEDNLSKVADSLETLAATVTFSSDSFFTLDKLVNEASESSETLNSDTPVNYFTNQNVVTNSIERTEVMVDPLPASANQNLVTNSNKREEVMVDPVPVTTNQNDVGSTNSIEREEVLVDPLPELDVDDNDLGMIFDLFEVSSSNTTGRNEEKLRAISHSIVLACPNPNIHEQIRSILISSTDYNNPTEYFLAADGVSRTGLHRGAICRARIKKLICEHFDFVWTNAAVKHIPPFDTCADVIQSALNAYYNTSLHGSFGGTVGGKEDGRFKCFAFECFVALAASMLEMDDWRTPWNRDSVTFVSDVEDIRFVGYLVHYLWECMKRSLHDCAVHDGDNIALVTERNAAISSIVDQLKFICRLEHIL